MNVEYNETFQVRNKKNHEEKCINSLNNIKNYSFIFRV